jgi:dUTPase
MFLFVDYCGEVHVILHNHSEDVIYIKTGQRIAQLIIEKIEECVLICDDTLILRKTSRQCSGFGSTGQ